MYKNANLKNKTASYFISKSGLRGDSRGIVIEDKQAIAKTIGKLTSKGENHDREKGGNWEGLF